MFYESVKEFVKRSKSISELKLPVTNNISRLASGFPSSYMGLNVKVSYGRGNWAEITWIGFLGDGQEIQKGIYPVFLYYRSLDLLILSYGVSATYPPAIQWELQAPKTIGFFFMKTIYKLRQSITNRMFIRFIQRMT